MSEVKRYNYEFRGMIERPKGQFVLAADYAALKEQFDFKQNLTEQVVALQKQCDALAAENVALKEFFSLAISAAFEGCDWYGDDIQGKALELGLIREEKYDHEKHAESVFNPEDFQQGDMVFTINETPATDAYLNSVRADGALNILSEMLEEISATGKGASRWKLGFIDYAWAVVAEKKANYSNQLRGGESS